MANNRIEATSAVDAQMIPEIDASELRDVLNDEIIESIVFRKDVIASETPAAGSVTVDFSNKDTATISTTVNLAISFSGLENGDIKTIALTKVATNTVSFIGSTDVSPRKLYINTSITYVEYEVRNKNGIITVNSKNIDNDITIGVTAEIDSAILESNGNVKTKYVEIGDWNMDTTSGINISWSTLGITDWTKVISGRALIRADSDTYRQMLNSWYTGGQEGGGISMETNFLSIYRVAGGTFDSASFDSTSFNRGWLILEYID